MDILKNDDILIITSDKKDGDFSRKKIDNIQNYLDLCYSFNINLCDLYLAKQSHSDILNEIKNYQNIDSECDAIYTKVKGLYLGILTADCLPILGYDLTNNIVFAIHSGWKGSSKLITYKTIKHLIDNENLDINNTYIYLCPSISHNVYEVDNIVYNAFIEYDNYKAKECFTNKANNKYLFNNKQFNINILLSLGIKNNNIIDSNKCTYQDNYHSYRKNKTDQRNISIIGIKENY